MNVFTAFEALDEKVVATSAAMAEATAALERHRDERRVFVFGATDATTSSSAARR